MTTGPTHGASGLKWVECRVKFLNIETDPNANIQNVVKRCHFMKVIFKETLCSLIVSFVL